MKKLLCLLIVSLTVLPYSTSFAFVKTDEMQSSLENVKQKIDVRDDLKKFSSQKYENENSTTYGFYWTNDDNECQTSVTADGEGHIINYQYYTSTLYNDKDVSRLLGFSEEQILQTADDFIKKAAPELFSDPLDCLKLENKNSIDFGNNCTIEYIRSKDGVYVSDNRATISIYINSECLCITDLNINWDYKTQFAKNEPVLQNPDEAYLNVFPIELIYKNNYSPYFYKYNKSPEIKLVYRINNNSNGYINASSGETVLPDSNDIIFAYDSTNEAASLSSGMGEKKDMGLRPEEIQEIESVSGLFSADEIFSKLKKIKQLKISSDVLLSGNRIYKDDEDYFVSFDANSKNEKQYVNVTANAKTGEIINYSNYKYNENNNKKNDINESKIKSAKSEMSKFLNDQYKDKIAQCIIDENENTDGQSYIRLVDGIKYIDNGIDLYYDYNHNMISGINLNWTKDLGNLSKQSDAMEILNAWNNIKKSADFNKIYIKSNNEFVLCYGLIKNEYSTIDAITGENEYKDRNKKYNYSDILNHWAYDVIDALSNISIGLDCEKLEPDSKINQSDFLKLLCSCFYYESFENNDNMYERLDGIITKEERNDDLVITRETALDYMTRFMGYQKIAKIKNIFKTGFSDEAEINPDLVGTIALMRGMNIISSDSTEIRPKDNITRAEAFCILYNYLKN